MINWCWEGNLKIENKWRQTNLFKKCKHKNTKVYLSFHYYLELNSLKKFNSWSRYPSKAWFTLSFQKVSCSKDGNDIKQGGRNSIKLNRLASMYCWLCASHWSVSQQLYEEVLWQSPLYNEDNMRPRVISQKDSIIYLHH